MLLFFRPRLPSDHKAGPLFETPCRRRRGSSVRFFLLKNALISVFVVYRATFLSHASRPLRVDAALPVVLSKRVPLLVSCYAAVPSVEGVFEGTKAGGANKVATSEEQKAALGEIAGATNNPDDYGCAVM